MMMFRKLKVGLLIWGLVTVRWMALMASGPGVMGKGSVKVVPTFYCLGVYWSPEGGEGEKRVLVKFRGVGRVGGARGCR
jgi:hypothetical protein